MAKRLRLGKMTTYELANWFGITYDSFIVMKEQKLDKLKEYCKFSMYAGGIEIEEIYKDTYEKKKKKKKKKVKTKTLFRNGQWIEVEVGKISEG